MASFFPENEFQKAINAEMNPKIPVYLQRSSASSPPRRSRVFQWSPGWPSAGAATSAWCNRCRRTQLLHRQTNKGQTDLMLLINMIKCFYKSNKLSCTNYYTKILSFPASPITHSKSYPWVAQHNFRNVCYFQSIAILNNPNNDPST